MENHHAEAYTNTSPKSKSELEQLNELSSSPHVDEQTKQKQPEMVSDTSCQFGYYPQLINSCIYTDHVRKRG